MLNSVIFGILTVPQDMSYQSWIELFMLADYFSMPRMKEVCVHQLSLRLHEQSVESIYKFAKAEGLKELGYLCAKYRMQVMQLELEK